MNRLALLAFAGIAVLGTTSIGCAAPGLSHHGVYAQVPIGTVTEEVGTATITSAPVLKEESAHLIIPEVRWDDEVDDDGEASPAYSPYPGLSTWGAAPKQLSAEEKYGF